VGKGKLFAGGTAAAALGALKAGSNALEIKVTNVWVNRLIGDQQPGATRIAFSATQPYRADSPLLPSGLLGPVKVVTTTPGASKEWFR